MNIKRALHKIFSNVVDSSCKSWCERPCDVSTALGMQTVSTEVSVGLCWKTVENGTSVTVNAVSGGQLASQQHSDWVNQSGYLSPPLALLMLSDYFRLAALPLPSVSLHLTSLPFLSRLMCAASLLHFVMQFSWDNLCYSSHSGPPFSPPLWSLYDLFSLQHDTPVLLSITVLCGSSFLSWPLLICSAPDIHLYMSHWSLSAELSITLSLLSPSLPPLPVLLDLILLLSEICFSLHRATEVFFISDGFISTRHKGWAACEASHFTVSQCRGNYLVSVAHAV